MEEINKNAQIDDEDIEVEPDDADLDDEDWDREDFGGEEYNFNDDEDLDEDTSEPQSDPVTKDEEPSPKEPIDAPADKETPAEATEENSEVTKMKESMALLLDRLGYRGDFDSAMAAFNADEAAKARAKAEAEAKKTDGEENLPSAAELKEAVKTETNYREMAERDLRDINAAFGTRYTDYSQFDDLERFAMLRGGGATALEAFRATQRRFVSPEKEPAAEPLAKPLTDHLKALPTAGSGGSVLSGPDREALAALRELYPEASQKDLFKTLQRVRRAH